MRLLLLLTCWLPSLLAAQTTQPYSLPEAETTPYQTLADGYRLLDPALAASAYHPQAWYLSMSGSSARYGLAQIEQGFASYLNQNKEAGNSLALAFRIEKRSVEQGYQGKRGTEAYLHIGYYRLSITTNPTETGDAQETHHYGRFVTRLVPEAGTYVFILDAFGPATAELYTAAPIVVKLR